METYQWTAPSGVSVSSTVPPVPDAWQDHLLLHFPWSYWQWTKKIGKAYDVSGKMARLKKRMTQ